MRKLAVKHRFVCPLWGNDVRALVREGKLALGQAHFRLAQYVTAAEVFQKLLDESAPTHDVLRWLGLGVDEDLASTMVAEECEVLYSTLGTQSFGGLDRGRKLSEMDEELVGMLSPFWTPKLNYSATPAAAMLTNVFWDEPVFGAVTVLRDRLSRVARVVGVPDTLEQFHFRPSARSRRWEPS